MLTCYVIDDEAHAIKSLVSHIEKTPLLQLLGTSQDPLQALSQMEEKNQYPDITFLDIDMPQISGLELSSMLKDKTSVVFTTAHPHFAVDAFEMEASDYLLKPIAFHRFLKCVHRISERLAEKKQTQEGDDFFFIQTEGKGKLTKLYFDEVLYIESQKNYVAVVTTEKKHLTYLTLGEMEEKLPRPFMRINKSFLVNTAKITHVEGNEVFMEQVKTGFVIGAAYKENFTNYMKDHLVRTRRFGQ
jgi:two-component system LytT family response regulator